MSGIIVELPQRKLREIFLEHESADKMVLIALNKYNQGQFSEAERLVSDAVDTYTGLIERVEDEREQVDGDAETDLKVLSLMYEKMREASSLLHEACVLVNEGNTEKAEEKLNAVIETSDVAIGVGQIFEQRCLK